MLDSWAPPVFEATEELRTKRSRRTTEQIIAIPQQHAAGAAQAELMRRHDISGHMFYTWKKRYGDPQVSDAKRLKALEEENARLKRRVADQALNLQILEDVLGKGS